MGRSEFVIRRHAPASQLSPSTCISYQQRRFPSHFPRQNPTPPPPQMELLAKCMHSTVAGGRIWVLHNLHFLLHPPTLPLSGHPLTPPFPLSQAFLPAIYDITCICISNFDPLQVFYSARTSACAGAHRWFVGEKGKKKAL